MATSSMDQFTAHLDRGWDLVQRGDTRGAEASARRALEIDPNSPEAHNLLGYVAAMAGDGEEAIEAYQQAIALDDTYLEAMLNAAEVYIAPLGDFDQAIRLCDQALDLAEIDEEVIDALLLKFDALVGKGDLEEAAAVLRRIPAGPYENPAQAFLVGRAHYELGQHDKAMELIEETCKKDPEHAEAHYYAGLLRDARGDQRGATQAFLRSRELDVRLGLPPWSPSGEDFGEMTGRALEGLAPMLRQYVVGADVYVTDAPGVELVADGVDPRALVLLDGLADEESTSPRATRVFVYAINVTRVAGSPDTVEAEIADALEREISATFLEQDPDEEPPPRDSRDLN
jgi:tetratricopeptide (TPR) repeat protein